MDLSSLAAVTIDEEELNQGILHFVQLCVISGDVDKSKEESKDSIQEEILGKKESEGSKRKKHPKPKKTETKTLSGKRKRKRIAQSAESITKHESISSREDNPAKKRIKSTKSL